MEVVEGPQERDVVGLDDEFSRANHGTSSAGAAEKAPGGGGGGCPYIGLESRDGLLEPMLLWDAGMGYSIARALEADRERLVVHVCGSFHCEKRCGIVEMVEAFRPARSAPRQLVVVMYPEKDCHVFRTEQHAGRGDFVVLTDATLQRSHDYMMDAPKS